MGKFGTTRMAEEMPRTRRSPSLHAAIIQYNTPATRTTYIIDDVYFFLASAFNIEGAAGVGVEVISRKEFNCLRQPEILSHAQYFLVLSFFFLALVIIWWLGRVGGTEQCTLHETGDSGRARAKAEAES